MISLCMISFWILLFSFSFLFSFSGGYHISRYYLNFLFVWGGREDFIFILFFIILFHAPAPAPAPAGNISFYVFWHRPARVHPESWEIFISKFLDDKFLDDKFLDDKFLDDKFLGARPGPGPGRAPSSARSSSSSSSSSSIPQSLLRPPQSLLNLGIRAPKGSQKRVGFHFFVGRPV